MAFKIYSTDDNRVPGIEYLPASAITPKVGMALTQTTGQLALATGATAPTYISMCEKDSECTAGDIIPVIRVGKDMILETTFAAAATSIKLGDKVTFKEQNACGDSTLCSTIVNQYVSQNVDLIMANATDALVAARTATNTIPIVGTSITSYGVALSLKDETATKTGINVTGTADLAPLDKQAAMVKEWVPDAKKVGILYCSAEKNSKYQATVVGAKLKEMGLEVKEYTAADSNEIASVTKLACQNSDVLYVPTDNTMASSAKTIDNIAQPAGVPIIAGEEGICSGCGIATLSISYYDIGYKAGEMAYDILVNGKDPATMDIEFVPEDKLTKEYDAARCKALGVKVVDGYKAIES